MRRGSTNPMFTPSFRRELLSLWRRPTAVLYPLLFALLVVMLFGIALGPTPTRLSAVAPSVLLIVVLLAQLLSTDSLLHDEAHEGQLDLWLSSPRSVTALLYGKILARVLAISVPLLLSLPITLQLLRLPLSLLPVLAGVLALLALSTALLGLIAAALTVRLARGAMLSALLVLPLNVPLLLFALGAVEAMRSSDDVITPLLWLSAQTVGLLSLAPLTAAFALRASSE